MPKKAIEEPSTLITSPDRIFFLALQLCPDDNAEFISFWFRMIVYFKRDPF